MAPSLPNSPFALPARGALRARRAFTILELAVCIAVVTLLLGLLFPALQQGREAARRVQCSGNLRQIGLALFLYHDTYGALPPGWIETGSPPTGWGWASQLLPQLDQHPLARQIQFDLPVSAGANALARTQSLPIFICPSDHVPHAYMLYKHGYRNFDSPTASLPPPPSDTALFELAGASYVGIFGTEHPDETPGHQGTGVFLADRPVRLSEIRRGPSHILLVGERTAQQFPSTWVGTDPAGEETPAQVVGAANYPPNHPDADETEFSSRHPGGAHFLLGDGHVGFITNDADRIVYRAQAVRDLD